jgi:hypothetical protein
VNLGALQLGWPLPDGKRVRPAQKHGHNSHLYCTETVTITLLKPWQMCEKHTSTMWTTGYYHTTGCMENVLELRRDTSK